MSSKIQELTEKIYDEGIAKAKNEAVGIIAEAQKKADKIIDAAKNEEAKILGEAKNNAAEYKEKIKAEINIASRQAINNVKQVITKLIVVKQVQPELTDIFKNSEFLGEVITELIKNWNPQKPEESDIQFLLPKNKEDELNKYFDGKAKNTLNKGVEVIFDSGVSNGFKIGPKDGSYIISFSDKDFEDYFTGYLKDKTKELLFAK